MGPNGSGKSTLANTIMGNPNYEVTEGQILFNGEDLTEADPDERARAGLFMAFQYPATIPGVSVANFLRLAVNARREDPIKVKDFGKLLRENVDMLRIDREFVSRYLNEGFSGGEKKRAEILQLAMLKPEIAVLDETDSGLDIDALRIVADGVNALRGPEMGTLIITHYTRILGYVKPDFVHIMLDGRIVREGGPELADELEEKGYEFVREEVAAANAAGPSWLEERSPRGAGGLRGRARAHLAPLGLLDHARCASSTSTRSRRATTSPSTSCRRCVARGHRRRPAGRPDRAARRQHDPVVGRPRAGRAGRDRLLARACRRGALRTWCGSGTCAGSPTRRASSPPPRAAFWTGGAFVYVPKDVQVERPIQIVYLIDEPGTAQYAHTLAVVGEHAECSIREYCLAPPIDGQALHAGGFELYARPGARRQGRPLPGLGPGEVYDISTKRVEIARDAFVSWVPIHLGGRLTKQTLDIVTAEQGSDMRHTGPLLHRARRAPRPVHHRQARGRATPPATPSGRARSPATRARRTRA